MADTFVIVMARIRSIDDDVDSDDPDRHAYWKMRQLAESFIADGFRRAADVHDVTLSMKMARTKRSDSPA